MLVLTRRQQESVVVGRPGDAQRLLRVTVLTIRPGQVRLGFEAPDEVPVHRWEVWQKLHAAEGPGRPPQRPAAAGE